MSAEFDYVFISQATSRNVFELARRAGRKLGPTLLISGNTFPQEPGDPLTVWNAPSYDNTSYQSRAITWSLFLLSTARLCARIEGSPTVLVQSNPPLGPWLGALLKQFRGWRVVVRILDVYPDLLVRSGVLRPSHPLVSLWRAGNHWAYALADEVTTIAPVMAERVAAQIGGQRVRVIPDWVDVGGVRPMAKSDNPFALEHGLTETFNVLYSGNLGLTHDISGLFEAAEILRYDKGIKFVLIGGGARRQEFESLAERLPNVLALPFQAEEKVPFAMAAGDIGVVTLGKGAEGVSIPSKSYSMMAAGCALLGLSYGDNDVRRLVDDHQCGINVPADDGRAVVQAIRSFAGDQQRLLVVRRAARAAVERYFSTTVCETELLQLLASVGSSSSPAGQPAPSEEDSAAD